MRLRASRAIEWVEAIFVLFRMAYATVAPNNTGYFTARAFATWPGVTDGAALPHEFLM